MRRVPRGDGRAGAPDRPDPAARRGRQTGWRPLTGFEYHPAAGLVAFDEFYGSLADGVFHSTQYIRHHAQPAVHARAGSDPRGDRPRRHARQPPLRRAQPARRAAPPGGWRPRPAATSSPRCSGSRSSSASSTRDGRPARLRRRAASSYGEIEEFRGAEIRPLDIAEMGVLEYDITKYQPILFAADGIEHLLDVVGGFFAECDDDTPARLGRRSAGARLSEEGGGAARSRGAARRGSAPRGRGHSASRRRRLEPRTVSAVPSPSRIDDQLLRARPHPGASAGARARAVAPTRASASTPRAGLPWAARARCSTPTGAAAPLACAACGVVGRRLRAQLRRQGDRPPPPARTCQVCRR